MEPNPTAVKTSAVLTRLTAAEITEAEAATELRSLKMPEDLINDSIRLATGGGGDTIVEGERRR